MHQAVFIVLIFLSICLPTLSQAEGKYKKRPKIGLVLSGGGARGAAHVGVLKVLEELRIPIDYIAGTSMGSIVGGLYASGKSAQQIEDDLKAINWVTVFHDKPERPDRSFRRKLDDALYLVKKKPGYSDGKIKLPLALIQGQKFDLVLNRLTAHVNNIHDFSRLPIPFKAVAADIETGKEVIFSSGNLARALRASMAVPGIFSPIKRNGMLLVDGGIANNLPINIVRNMGADILIVVNIGTPPKKSKELKTSLDMIYQMISLLGQRYLESQLASLKSKDILINPNLGNMSSAAFKDIAKVMPIGAIGANKVRSQLARLSVSKQAYNTYLAARKIPDIGKPTIQFVTIKNNSNLSDKMIRKRIALKPGDELDTDKLEKNIERIYGLDVFQNVRYEVVNKNGELGIEISAVAKEWGPNYLQFGLALSDNFEGDSTYNIGIAYTRTAINDLNGEWRTALQIGQNPSIATEIYQPLDIGSRYFINPLVFIKDENINAYDAAGNLLAEFRLNRYGISIDGGRNFGNWGELRVGYQFQRGEAKVRVGDPSFADLEFDAGKLFARLSADTLDNGHFPRHGYIASLEYSTYNESLGSDDEFDQVLLNIGAAFTRGRNTLITSFTYNTTLDSNGPIYGRFGAGGLFKLSGYNLNELSGQHFGIIKAAYLHKVGHSEFVPTYLGASLEYGGVSQDSGNIIDNFMTAGSVFLGLDTVAGPVYFGVGYAEGGHSSIYLQFGKIF